MVPHVVLLITRDRKGRTQQAQVVLSAEKRWVTGVLAWSVAGLVVLGALGLWHQPVEWDNEFPEDYHFEEGGGPFRPSLATTATGGAYDERSLAGSESCGSAGCHETIYR